MASSSSARSAHPAAKPVLSLDLRVRHERQALKFFDSHKWLLSDPRFADEARRQIALHRANLARALAQALRASPNCGTPSQAARPAGSRLRSPRQHNT